jgi:hypothetical protein
MPRNHLLVLFLLGLLVASVVAWLQHWPGYIDADYYMAGGLRLVQGFGFNEIVIWNYLDDPAGLPHPSHSYWMPLASIIAALGMGLTGQHDFYAARLPFILLAGLVPPVTSLLAYRLTARRELALLSGLLAVFPTYNVSYLAAIDNFTIYRILGALFFLSLSKVSYKSTLGLGLVAGFMNLSRTDGLLWLALAFLVILLHLFSLHRFNWRCWVRPFLFSGVLILLGYFLVMAPWFARNLTELGAPMAPGGSRAMLLVKYEDTYIYPASQLTFERWLDSGWQSIVSARLNAFWINLGTAFFVFGGVFVGPFILVACWKLRQDLRIQIGALGFTALFLVMTLLFPFAGPRGSFLHAGVAFMPLGWAIAPIGLEAAVTAARRRNWFTPQAQRIFRVILFAANLILTFPLVHERVVSSQWDLSAQTFRQVEAGLLQAGAEPGDVVMVTNPPGYYLASGRAAVASPDAEFEQVLDAARVYGVRYLILERTSIPNRLVPFLELKVSSPNLGLVFTQENGVVVYEFLREE